MSRAETLYALKYFVGSDAEYVLEKTISSDKKALQTRCVRLNDEFRATTQTTDIFVWWEVIKL